MADARVLIVDDEEGIVRLCERLLERANFEVASTSDPVAGMARLKEEKFDLLLVDIRMPGVDGFAVIEAGRRNQPELAVVIMTGFGTLETAIKALRQGADGLILKPFEEGSELVKTVKEALSERKQKRENARLRALRPLLDIAETLFAETRTDKLYSLILKGIQEHLRCQHAAIYTRRASDAYLMRLASHGNALPEEHSRADAGFIGRADHWQVPIWANRDTPGDENLKSLLGEYALGGLICMPVERTGGGLVFMAGRDKGEAAFQLADLELFGILAHQAEAALENARLYEELREKVRQVEESQRALIQAEKMAAVGRLTASIAHEVNNPLQAVQNCLHLAGRRELSAEERASNLKMAENELNRLMATVDRMMAYYRPSARDRKPTNLNDLLDTVLALLEKQLSENNIGVTLNYSKHLPEALVVSNQIQQVFFNLILNAMDAMPKGGSMSIETLAEDGHIDVLFADNGVGVPQDERENIFEPFISTKEHGSGLGLSVSYGILTAHGGSLELVPNKGQGATFRVSIPIGEAK